MIELQRKTSGGWAKVSAYDDSLLALAEAHKERLEWKYPKDEYQIVNT